jgi:hypothetical protein
MNRFEAPQLNFPTMDVHPNLNVQIPNTIGEAPDPFGLMNRAANQAMPNRFDGVNATARGNAIPDLPVTAEAARRTLDNAGIKRDVAAEWRQTAQAQWEAETGRQAGEAARFALMHHQMNRFLIDEAEKSETTDAK